MYNGYNMMGSHYDGFTYPQAKGWWSVVAWEKSTAYLWNGRRREGGREGGRVEGRTEGRTEGPEEGGEGGESASAVRMFQVSV